jgi:hypothetical protein
MEGMRKKGRQGRGCTSWSEKEGKDITEEGWMNEEREI